MEPESTLDKIADALGHQIRRHVPVELMDHNPVDHRETVVESTAHDARNAEAHLVHTHLPNLADMDVV